MKKVKATILACSFAAASLVMSGSSVLANDYPIRSACYTDVYGNTVCPDGKPADDRTPDRIKEEMTSSKPHQPTL